VSDFDEVTMQAAIEGADYDPNAKKVHVLRAQLPWREDDGLTECGKPTAGLDVLSRADAAAKAKQWGQRRATLMFCMTCRDHTYAWMTWEQSPIAVMARECQRRSGSFGRMYSDDARSPLDYELRALGLLVAAHREEFAATLAGLRDTTDLGARRRRRA